MMVLGFRFILIQPVIEQFRLESDLRILDGKLSSSALYTSADTEKQQLSEAYLKIKIKSVV
jgi:hypothetical protein